MTYTEIINSIKKGDLERHDKFSLSELIYDKTIKDFNLRMASLRKKIVENEDTLNALANQRTYDFYMGNWAAYNLIADEKDQIKTALTPELDQNGQPMWLEELMHKAKEVK
jgi:hypothetical protein